MATETRHEKHCYFCGELKTVCQEKCRGWEYSRRKLGPPAPPRFFSCCGVRLETQHKHDCPRRPTPDGIRIEVYQEDWIPGFAAFHDDGELKDTAKAHVVLNLAANLLAVEDGDIPKSDLPYIIAENIMHEVIHVLEAWCDQEFSEERVEALLTKYRDKYKPDAPAYTNPAIGSEFPKEHGTDGTTTGVE